jgi:imidazolonepropionase-like amidohydrolase
VRAIMPRMRPLTVSATVLALALGLSLDSPRRAHAQAGRSTVLVIDGGTLIDGRGGPPVADVQVVIEGNRIRGIGRRGTPAPSGAQVIDAAGKFIVPGLWDSLVNFVWYQGEVFLNNGVTSYIGIGDMGEVFVMYQEGLERGKFRGPRAFDWPVHFQGGPGFFNITGLESPFDSPHLVESADDVREWTRRVLDLGGRGISFQNAAVSPEVFRAAVEVAHAAGKPVGIRAGGGISARDAALMGADFIPRSQGVAADVTALPGAGANELEQWAQMDEAKAADLIRVLVERRTALIPSFIQKAPGMPSGWDRFELQVHRLFANPFLMAYYPAAQAQTIAFNYLEPPDLQPEVVDVRRRGYQNALRFHRMLIEAGGRVLVGTDGGNFSVPGLGVHHEAQIFAEDMGLSPAQVLQAATRWPAETMRVQDQVGTVAAGMLADLLIVDANPLDNIANMQRIAAVVADGVPQDLRYHASYWNPFQGNGPVTIPVVDDIVWAVGQRPQGRGGPPPAGGRGTGAEAGRGAAAGGGRGAPAGARGRGAAAPPLPDGLGGIRRPQPTIETIDSGRRDYADPDYSRFVVKEGGETLTITLTGLNYFQRSQVYFNDIPVPTRVVSRTEIQATIDETLLRVPGRFPIVVRNLGQPDPFEPGLGDTSNRAWLIVGYR